MKSLSFCISKAVLIIKHIMLRFAISCTNEQELLKIRTTFHLPELFGLQFAIFSLVETVKGSETR